MALVFGLGLMVTMMSAKNKTVLNTYYYDQIGDTWHPLDRVFDNTPDENEEYEENSYQCSPNPLEYCTGEFDSSVSSIPGSATPDGSSVRGNYTENN